MSSLAKFSFQNLIVEIELTVLSGSVGIACVQSDDTNFAGPEIVVGQDPSRQNLTLPIENIASIDRIVFRNAEEFGAPTSIDVFNITVFAAEMLHVRSPALSLQDDLSSISTQQLRQMVDISDDVEGPGIDVVASCDLGSYLEYSEPFEIPFTVYTKSLTAFKMEVDDAPILRYLFRNSAPKRHLEFGTWQGFGVTLCAQSCDAEIWTLNLPEGERNASGEALYSGSVGAIEPTGISKPSKFDDNYQPTDAGEMIGWMYRAAGYAPRVHQILIDSKVWDTSSFAPGFFDTVLIDGGHAPDVVTRDTEKALPLVHAGGLILWHDFCPDPIAIKELSATKGVVTAIAMNLEKWRPKLRKLFWIQPSFLLVGVKA